MVNVLFLLSINVLILTGQVTPKLTFPSLVKALFLIDNVFEFCRGKPAFMRIITFLTREVSLQNKVNKGAKDVNIGVQHACVMVMLNLNL